MAILNTGHAESEAETKRFMQWLTERNPGQPEFHQAVREVAESVISYILDNPPYRKARILERLTEPDRIIIFRVSWMDDNGNFRINRGYRVQCNNAIGPYKGGIRFHPSVTLSILKFLAFEQVLKNSLTGLPMGGAKGGSDFDPRDKSDAEIMRFCQSFMTELGKHIGHDIDVPAGDIGVGEKEIGYMFGHYTRIANEFTGAMTGKGISFGGSQIRKEATGYGLVYFADEMLHTIGESVYGLTCLVSGAGNVALHAAEKLIQSGGKVITLSDETGFVYDRDGVTLEKLEFAKSLRYERRTPIHLYAEKFNCDFYPGEKPWRVPAQAAFPCAIQNELNGHDAETLVKNGVIAVAEGANMPTDLEGTRVFLNAKILYCPGKAANAGGVSVSGLEQSQNSLRLSWSRKEVDEKLKEIMRTIHTRCIDFGSENGYTNYVKGANLAGFVRVADAMLAYGVV